MAKATKVERKLHACSRCGSLVERPTPEALRKIRRDAGMPMRALAAKWGLSIPYLSGVERGLRHCTPRMELLYLELAKSKRAVR